MAETQSKRRRDETQIEDIDETKRHKSYNHILSILEEEEDELTHDLSSLITTLQQELSSSPTDTTRTNQENCAAAVEDYPSSSSSSFSSSSSSSAFLKEEEEDNDKERVIRHLLEASDDELGIPNREIVNGVIEYGYEEEFVSSESGLNGSDGFSLCDGLWEFEDANANYYTLLQSELFM